MKIKVTPEERQVIFDSVGSICAHCQRRAATEAHHNPPRAASQKREKSELVPLCVECHAWAHQSTYVSYPILKQELVAAQARQQRKDKTNGEKESA